MRIFKRFLMITLFFVTGTACSHVFYQPSDVMFLQNPDALDKYKQDVQITSLDGAKLAGWFFPARKGGHKGTVIQFHGNAQNMTSHFASLFWMTEQGYDLLTFDYHGYGISEGKPSQEALNQDAVAVVRYAMQTKKAARIFLWGQSLGGAVVMRAFRDLSSEEKSKIKAMIVEGTFYNYHVIARQVLSKHWLTWIFQPLAYMLVSNGYGPEDDIPKISPIPLLVIHGDEDPVIPFENGKKIFELAKDPKQFWAIRHGHHIDSMFVDHQKYQKKITEYLASLQ